MRNLGTIIAAASVMSYIDLSIIYLACGAPIAAEFALRSGSQISITTVWFTAVRLLVWPVFAINLILGRLDATNRTNDRLSSLAIDLNAAKSRLESALFSSSKTVAIFEYRELFDRYAGLCLNSDDDVIDTGVSKLLALEAHPNVNLAKACFERRNRSIVAYHRDLVREEFRDLIDSQLVSADSLIKQYATDAANLVGDRSTINHLSIGETVQHARHQAGRMTSSLAGR